MVALFFLLINLIYFFGRAHQTSIFSKNTRARGVIIITIIMIAHWKLCDKYYLQNNNNNKKNKNRNNKNKLFWPTHISREDF